MEASGSEGINNCPCRRRFVASDPEVSPEPFFLLAQVSFSCMWPYSDVVHYAVMTSESHY